MHLLLINTRLFSSYSQVFKLNTSVPLNHHFNHLFKKLIRHLKQLNSELFVNKMKSISSNRTHTPKLHYSPLKQFRERGHKNHFIQSQFFLFYLA